MGVGLAARTDLEEAADGRGRDSLAPGDAVPLHRRLLQTGQADAGDARRGAGEELGGQGARQAQHLEFAAAAIGGDHADPLASQGLQQTRLDAGLVVQAGVAQRQAGIKAPVQTLLEQVLGQPGVDGGGADPDQDRESVRIQRLGGAHHDGAVGAQARLGQAAVDPGGGQDHRRGQAIRRAGLVGQHDQGGAVAGGGLGLVHDPVQGGAQAGA